MTSPAQAMTLMQGRNECLCLPHTLSSRSVPKHVTMMNTPAMVRSVRHSWEEKLGSACVEGPVGQGVQNVKYRM